MERDDIAVASLLPHTLVEVVRPSIGTSPQLQDGVSAVVDASPSKSRGSSEEVRGSEGAASSRNDGPTRKLNDNGVPLCDVCGFSACTSYVALMGHKASMHNYRPNDGYPCRFCSKKLPLIKDLRVHIRVHKNERVNPCPMCFKLFKSRKAMRGHKKKIHESWQRFPCKVCGRALKSQKSLQAHEMTHSAENRVACQICAKTFASDTCLRIHMKSHETERPTFQCDLCVKKLATKLSLESHMKSHSEERPFQCDSCKAAFRQKTHLQTHMRFVHPENGKAERDYRFHCEICSKKFYSKWNLKVHLQAHSKGSI